MEQVFPELTEREADLGWIASTPAEHPWRIAVIGRSKDDAISRFRLALARWEELGNERAQAQAGPATETGR